MSRVPKFKGVFPERGWKEEKKGSRKWYNYILI